MVWCPVARVEIINGGWQYLWQKCGTENYAVDQSQDDLDLGCPVGGTGGSSACAISPPGDFSRMASPPALNEEPLRILATSGGGTMALASPPSRGGSLIRKEGTSVARIPGENRFVRIHRYLLDASAYPTSKSEDERRFSIGEEIGASEWQAESASEVKVSLGRSRFAPTKSYLLLQEDATGRAIPTRLKSP